jgi:hypothetical protein
VNIAPRVSIITINWNSGETVKRTISSILAQTYPSLEWIIIDGGSRDESAELLHRAVRPGDHFISEPDGGIADAMNKGLTRATGEAVLFMNAGDEFASPTALEHLVNAWDHSFQWIIGAGDILREDGTLLFRRTYTSTPKNPLELVQKNCRIMHQAVLAERRLFTEFGSFNNSFRIAMDYELWIRWLTRGIIPQVVPLPVCRFWRGGTSGNPIKNHRENRRARELHGIGNGLLIEGGLCALAGIKSIIGGRYGKKIYRWKEKMGIRI